MNIPLVDIWENGYDDRRHLRLLFQFGFGMSLEQIPEDTVLYLSAICDEI